MILRSNDFNEKCTYHFRVWPLVPICFFFLNLCFAFVACLTYNYSESKPIFFNLLRACAIVLTSDLIFPLSCPQGVYCTQ